MEYVDNDWIGRVSERLLAVFRQEIKDYEGTVARYFSEHNASINVAAVLYGIGARLDQNPILFFTLRDVDGQELVRKSMEQKLESIIKNAGKKSKREIAAKDVGEIFGL